MFPWKGTLTDAGERDGVGGKSQKNTKKTCKKHLFYMCFPRKETLTDAWDGDGGGRLFKKTKNINNILSNTFYNILFILYI